MQRTKGPARTGRHPVIRRLGAVVAALGVTASASSVAAAAEPEIQHFTGSFGGIEQDGGNCLEVPFPATFAVRTVADGTTTPFVETGSMSYTSIDAAVRTLDLGIEVSGAAFSPDGGRLVVTAPSGAVGLWDLGRGSWVSEPSEGQPFVGSPAFSPEGDEFSITAEGRVGRWDGRTGAFLGAVSVGDDTVPVYAPDGTRVVLAGTSGAVRSWDLDPASWVTAACRMAGRDLTDDEWHAQLPGRDRVPVCPREPT